MQECCEKVTPAQPQQKILQAGRRDTYTTVVPPPPPPPIKRTSATSSSIWIRIHIGIRVQGEKKNEQIKCSHRFPNKSFTNVMETLPVPVHNNLINCCHPASYFHIHSVMRIRYTKPVDFVAKSRSFDPAPGTGIG